MQVKTNRLLAGRFVFTCNHRARARDRAGAKQSRGKAVREKEKAVARARDRDEAKQSRGKAVREKEKAVARARDRAGAKRSRGSSEALKAI